MATAPWAEMPTEKTAFANVRRVRPGQIIAFEPGSQPRVLRNWSWLDKLASSDGITMQEAAEQTLEIFEAAVRERIQRGRPSAHLSGGLDSSAIVSVARDLTRRGVADHPLITVSLVYDMASLAPEREFIQQVIDQGGPLEPVMVPGDEHVDFDWFKPGIPEHDEPFTGLYQIGATRATAEAAHHAGATEILTGIAADDLFEGYRLHLADSFRRGQIASVVRECRQLARAKNTDFWTVFHRHVLHPALPGRLRDGLRPALAGGAGRWPKLGTTSTPPWVRRQFAHRYDCWGKGRATLDDQFRFPAEQSAVETMLQGIAGDWFSWHVAAPLGVHTTHPFKDPRLVRFALGLPRELREVPGSRKAVLREAMRGGLPESVRTRTLKRYMNEPHGRGLQRNLAELTKMISRSRINELGIFDTTKLAACAEELAMGVANYGAGNRICASLALIAWFDQLDCPLKQATPPTETIIP